MEHTIRTISEYLSERYSPWGWFGQRASDAASINQIIPLALVVSCDRGREIPYVLGDVPVLSVESPGGKRKDWSNEDLAEALSRDMGLELEKIARGVGRRINMLAYRSVRPLEEMKHCVRTLAVVSELKRYFDDKVRMYRALPELGLPRIPGLIGAPEEYSYPELISKFGDRFVVQFPYSSGGHFTFIIDDPVVYDHIKGTYPEQVSVIREYVHGISLNVNAVITGDRIKGHRVICSMPSVQLTGIPQCSNSLSAYCGNDYAASASLGGDVIKGVISVVDKAGQWMASRGYRGLFGMDLLLDEAGTIFPVEINPRFQNSTSLHTALDISEMGSPATPFLVHIAEFLRSDDDALGRYIDGLGQDDMMRPLRGSQIILHNGPSERTVQGDIAPGIYRRSGKGLLRLSGGDAVNDLAEEDMLVTCGVPEKGTVVDPGAPVCKIQTCRQVVGEDMTGLTREAAEAVGYVYDMMGLKEVVGSKSRYKGIRQ